VLPAESNSDDPNQVVQYMTSILGELYSTDNTSLLPDYFYSSAGYQPLQSQLENGTHYSSVTIVGTPTIRSSSTGEIDAEYNLQLGNQPPQDLDVTFLWNFTTGQWGAN